MPDFLILTRLTISAEDSQKLKAWKPGNNLFPDFAVLTGGAVYIELNGKAMAVVDNKLVAQAVVHPSKNPGNATNPASQWLPDYIGGFVQNLVTAAAQLTGNAQASPSAHFVDEPLALTFKHAGHNTITVTLRAGDGSNSHAQATVPTHAFYAAIDCVATDFLTEIAALNPALLNHPAVTMISSARAALPINV